MTRRRRNRSLSFHETRWADFQHRLNSAWNTYSRAMVRRWAASLPLGPAWSSVEPCLAVDGTQHGKLESCRRSNCARPTSFFTTSTRCCEIGVTFVDCLDPSNQCGSLLTTFIFESNCERKSMRYAVTLYVPPYPHQYLT